MQALMDRMIDALCCLRVPAILDERALGDEIARVLSSGGFSYRREARIAAGCRVDFWVENQLVLEVKSQQRAAGAIRRQLLRYAACDNVAALLLVTNTAVSMPAQLCGKPLRVLCLKRLWGIAL